MPDPSQAVNHRRFLRLATYFELGLLIIAYLIGWLLGIDPLENLHPTINVPVMGLAGTIPLLLFFELCYRLPFGKLHDIKRFLVDHMGPVLNSCHWTDLLYLGTLAGITEEVLFRGVLQPLLESHLGWVAGMVISNLFFALAHFITPLYAILAGLTGLYLGWTMDFGGERNLLTPIFIHALYDFLAFLAVARSYRAKHGLAF